MLLLVTIDIETIPEPVGAAASTSRPFSKAGIAEIGYQI